MSRVQTANAPLHSNGMSRFCERLGLVLSPGGAGASAWWVTNRILRLEVYRLVGRKVVSGSIRPHPVERFEYRCVSTLEDVRSLPERVVAALEANTSRELSKLVREDSRICFLTKDDTVACQLVASGGREVQMDTPRGLHIGPGPNGVVISYVYTHVPFRRMGAARELLERTEEDLGRQGVTFCAAHVSATNVPSLQTFAKVGWESLGLIGFSQNGKLVFSRLRGGHPLTIRSGVAP